MDQTDIIDKLLDNTNSQNAIDILMQVEETMDRLNIFAYDNWFEGEIVKGPEIDKYWVSVTFMYKYEEMPDPDGAARIIAKGGRVYYEKEVLVTAAKLREPEDVDPEGDPRRPHQSAAKKIHKKVWLVTVELPRNFMDTISAADLEIQNMQIDNEAVDQAEEQGLDSDNAFRD